MKKTLSILLSLILILTSLPTFGITALASVDYGYETENNNSLEKANYFNLEDGMSGKIKRDNDDYFKFKLTKATLITFYLGAGSAWGDYHFKNDYTVRFILCDRSGHIIFNNEDDWYVDCEVNQNNNYDDAHYRIFLMPGTYYIWAFVIGSGKENME